MEFIGSEKHAREGEDVKDDEKRSESTSIGDGGEDHHEEKFDVKVSPVTNIERFTMEAKSNASTSKNEEVDELETAKAEMGSVIKENQRLKTCLNRILNDYRTLQMQFQNIVGLETKISTEKLRNNEEETTEESELVSLSLGISLPNNLRNNNEKAAKASKLLKDDGCKEGLALGLDCKFETSRSGSTTENNNNYLLNGPSPANSSEVLKEEADEETSWLASKGQKTVGEGGEDEVSQQSVAKKARVCVRARCDAPTMNDGCQWRKYGQKISKGNPCPRAYYRCTVAPQCPVRKQVQRCAQDTSILITTYEGTHNHPLPLSATAMASTTSVAASMLLSSSSTSPHHTPSHFQGMNFYLSNTNNNANSKPNQFYLSHHPSLSPSPSHPTITLDLTSNPSSSSASSQFARSFTSNFASPQRYPSSLNFSSSTSNNAHLMSSSNNGLFSYYNSQPENIFRYYTQKNNSNNNNNIITTTPIPTGQNSETIVAATKVITADPTFQSALAVALSKIIGNSNGNANTTHHQEVGEISRQKMKWGELFPSSSLPSNSNVNGCASTFLNKASSDNTQKTSLTFPSTKSASASPGGDNRDSDN